MIRALLERTTRDWVFRRSLQVAGRPIPLFVSTSAGLRYLLKPMSRVDPVLLRAATHVIRPGDTVWDVGANVGLFSFAAAALSGPTGCVCALEPDPWLQNLIRRSAAIQPATSAPVRLASVAAASHGGQRFFAIATRSRSTNHLREYGTTQTGGVREVIEVSAITLDSALDFLPAPDVLKIDVEGAELEVLQGASQVLRSRPRLICEVSDENSQAVTAILHDAGYELVDGETMQPAARAGFFTIGQASNVAGR